MFDRDSRDLCVTLTEMDRRARERCNFNQNDARQKLEGWIKQDRRLDDYDAARLAERVQQCRSNGATLDLDDPRLRGGEARPLEKSRW